MRQARLDDWPRIAAFLLACYDQAGPMKQGRRWRWQFLDTPYPALDPSPGGTGIPVWIAVLDGQVVGQIALQPARLFIGGIAEPAGWIVDVMVHPGHRGVGLAHRIHDAVVASGTTLVTLTMADATRRLAERAGCITLGPVFQMVRTRRLSGQTVSALLAGPVARRSGLAHLAGRAVLSSGIGPALLAGAASAVGGVARLRRRPAAASGLGVGVATVAAPDLAALDAVFARAVTAYPALFDRGAAFLRWRFLQDPDIRYRWAQAVRDGAVAGAAVWRLPLPGELPVGTLTDILALPGDSQAIDALAGHAVAAMHHETEAIVAGASHPAHVGALRRHGFRVVRVHRPTVVTLDAGLAARIAAVPGAWHLTKADHDWDQFHPAHP